MNAEQNREPHRFLKNWVEIPVWVDQPAPGWSDYRWLDTYGIDHRSVMPKEEQRDG